MEAQVYRADHGSFSWSPAIRLIFESIEADIVYMTFLTDLRVRVRGICDTIEQLETA